MTITPEVSEGAITICLTIVGMGSTGLAAMIGIYIKVRSDVAALQIGHGDLKTGVASLAGKHDVLTERMNKQDIMLERIASRIEIMGAVTSLPADIAAAMGKLIERDREHRAQ